MPSDEKWTCTDELKRWQAGQTSQLADAVRELLAENERLRAALQGQPVIKSEWEKLVEENERLRAALDTIERRLVEGYAPGMPWGNEEMALGIVREERAKALRGGDDAE